MSDVQIAQELDDVDRTIVDVLRANGRLSIPALAEQIGVSRATAYSRFDRLIDDGVIEGFAAQVTPSNMGLTVAALAFIKADQREWQVAVDGLLAVAGVQWIGLAAGSFDYVVLLRAADLDELRDVVLKELLAVPGVTSTETTVLLDEVRADSAIV